MRNFRKPQTLHDGEITIVEFGDALEHLGEDVMPAVSTAIVEAAEAIVPKILLDLTAVRFFGSSFIEVLYRLWKRMESRSGRFVIAGLDPYCREVLEVTNLDKLWTVVPDRESGLTVLRSDPTLSIPAPSDTAKS